MKRASAIVTNRGGRTCHAAIIARELGIPAVVGCGNATSTITEGQPVTVSCAEGDTGVVYEGQLDFEQQQIELDSLPTPPVQIMMNVGNPDRAFDFASIPNHGVGLARLEFIINRMIGVHPRALLEFDSLERGLQDQIRWQMAGYDDPVEFFVEKLGEGIACIAAAFSPQPVIVRLSDFKSNEYANLLGGRGVRAARGKPDARLPRRFALYGRGIRTLLRTRVQGTPSRARGHGPRQCAGHGPIRAHGGRGSPGRGASGEPWIEARREWPEADNDVRTADQCAARRQVPGAL